MYVHDREEADGVAILLGRVVDVTRFGLVKYETAPLKKTA